MATDTLYFSAMDIEEGGESWTNPLNIVGQYDVLTTATTTLDTDNDALGGSVDDVAGAPSSIDTFNVIFWSFEGFAGIHVDDVIEFQVNVGEGDGDNWEVLETFDSGNLLPSATTEFDYTVPMQTKFGNANDATDFINGLQFRWIMFDIVKGSDSVSIGCRGMKLDYTYTEPAPQARFSQAIIIT